MSFAKIFSVPSATACLQIDCSSSFWLGGAEAYEDALAAEYEQKARAIEKAIRTANPAMQCELQRSLSDLQQDYRAALKNADRHLY